MTITQLSITAAVTLASVVLGGWLTIRAQDRLWRRDVNRQWRDIRLAAYTEFVNAFREYVAYVLLPAAAITAVPRQRPPHDLMPFFDERGNVYKERLESAKTALRLVSDNPAVVDASQRLVRCARLLAVHRAEHEPGTLPSDVFDDLWTAERAFVTAARLELGLAPTFEAADRTD